VIIEQGRLLKAGTIDEIQMEDRPHRTIAVRVLEDLSGLQKELLQTPKIEELRLEGDQLLFDTIATEEEISDLLKALVQKDFKIIEFKPVKVGLEDIFMNITQGLVQ